jgi:predicted TPR repeat methyltransferase
MAAFPTLMDSSCMTATERWRQATVKYAQELENAGDMCGAADQYEAALTINSPDNQNFDGAAEEARAACNGATANNPDQPTSETPTQSAETPTVTPEPTVAPTDAPTTNG